MGVEITRAARAPAAAAARAVSPRAARSARAQRRALRAFCAPRLLRLLLFCRASTNRRSRSFNIFSIFHLLSWYMYMHVHVHVTSSTWAGDVGYLLLYMPVHAVVHAVARALYIFCYISRTRVHGAFLLVPCCFCVFVHLVIRSGESSIFGGTKSYIVHIWYARSVAYTRVLPCGTSSAGQAMAGRAGLSGGFAAHTCCAPCCRRGLPAAVLLSSMV